MILILMNKDCELNGLKQFVKLVDEKDQVRFLRIADHLDVVAEYDIAEGDGPILVTDSDFRINKDVMRMRRYLNGRLNVRTSTI